MGIFEDFFEEDEAEIISNISGITTGIVKENYDDKFPGMLKVDILLGEKGKCVTDWVRAASPYAGNNYGLYMLPEVGDEVVIAFNLGDSNRPYVIGSLWNSKQKIPEKTAVKDNTVKKIRTKGGHEIIFGEEKNKETIEIHTPGDLKITLADEKQLINIQDKDGNNMLSIDGKNGNIKVKAKSSIEFDAGGKASLKLDGNGNSATLKAGNITIEAQQALKLKGTNFNAEGNMVEVKGTGSLKVESSALLTLKGSMTKIN